MLNFGFELINPFTSRFKSLFYWNYLYAKHKVIEFQIMKTDTLVVLRFTWRVRSDHAGIELELGLLGYQLGFQQYDTRHWNDEANDWMNYEE